MPIKIPKGFGRRKSSGNALEEVENPPEPSFRVFERPQGGSKSFDGVNKLNRLSGGRPLSSPGNQFSVPYLENETASTGFSNRGSGGTDNSASTGGYYDNSSSSARFSSSSTLPSSAEVSTTEEPYLPRKQEAHHGAPVPPVPESRSSAFSLRAAGRTFSFGTKGFRSSTVPAAGATQPASSFSVNNATPERAMTTSSYASTTTAPKLETEVALGGSDLGTFGDMFKSFGRRRSTVVEEPVSFFKGMPRVPSPDEIPPAVPPKSYHTPSPTHVGRSQEVESSPYAWSSPHSTAGLMPSSSPEVPGSRIPNSPSPVLRLSNTRALTPSSSMPISCNYSPLDHGVSDRSALIGEDRRETGPILGVRPAPFEDEDAKLVMDSVNASRAMNRQTPTQGRGLGGLVEKVRDRDDRLDQAMLSGSSSGNSLKTPSTSSGHSSVRATDHVQPAKGTRQRSPVALFDSEVPEAAGASASWRDGSNDTTPRAKKSQPVHQRDPSISIDPSIADAANLAMRFEEHASAPPVRQTQYQNKVMTPAQFERYRQQRELSRTQSDASKSEESDEEDDHYDDEDEAERNRELAKQRRKQEAHLSVYRQQMMKVTGDQPARSPGMESSSASTTNLGSGISAMTLNDDKSSAPTKSSDDEDEDVPLGILAAHGFPNKNRPPAQLSSPQLSSSLHSTSQMGTYPPPPGSVAGDSTTGGPRGSVPVFARNLPQDPYYGASLVNPANREPMAFSHNGGGSIRGGGQASLPPGGLVGVIAGEERARAMRRGSPNAQGSYGPLSPNMTPMPQQMSGMGMGMPGMPGMPPMMTPGDHAQMQMSRQMGQMMQMQMQFMQQMMQMQGAQNGPPMQHQPQQHMMNNFLAPPGQMLRPTTMGSHSAPTTPGQPPQLNPRAMSMLDPATAQWNQQRFTTPGYAASGHLQIPGHQGYASSIAPSERSNVGMPPRYRPVSTSPVTGSHNAPGMTSTMMSGGLQDWSEKQGSQTTVRAVSPKKANGAGSDDDDEEGWEQMKQKREMKKSTWKTKKGSNGLEDVMWTQHSDL
ncbi:MAG: hypothetical protein M1836_007106 [Candelina mexicana]|nr:MAG: hypothetical protein M1836_007106 [Candelina mexicana]